MLGLSLSLLLAEKGYKVTLLEGASQIGGLTEPWQVGEAEWDKFYHVILPTDTFLLDLLESLGLRSQLIWKPTRTGVLHGGKIHSVSNTIEFLKYPGLTLFQKFRMGLNILYANRLKNWKKLEKITALEWLERWSGKSTTERFWKPLLRSKLGSAYPRASAAFIWTIMTRLYGARQAEGKQELFGFVEGGYRQILKQLRWQLESAGVEIKTATPVYEIRKSPNGGFVLKTENAEFEADRVVCTLPAPLAARICRDLPESIAAKCQKVEYLGIVCTSLLIRGEFSPYYVTNLTDEGLPFTGIINMSALTGTKRFGNCSLVYLPRYMPGDDPFWENSDGEVEKIFLEHLGKIYPRLPEEPPLAVRTARSRLVFALNRLNYSEEVPPVRSGLSGLYLANSSQIVNGTLNVNETLQVAQRAAEIILKDDA